MRIFQKIRHDVIHLAPYHLLEVRSNGGESLPRGFRYDLGTRKHLACKRRDVVVQRSKKVFGEKCGTLCAGHHVRWGGLEGVPAANDPRLTLRHALTQSRPNDIWFSPIAFQEPLQDGVLLDTRGSQCTLDEEMQGVGGHAYRVIASERAVGRVAVDAFGNGRLCDDGDIGGIPFTTEFVQHLGGFHNVRATDVSVFVGIEPHGAFGFVEYKGIRQHHLQESLPVAFPTAPAAATTTPMGRSAGVVGNIVVDLVVHMRIDSIGSCALIRLIDIHSLSEYWCI